MTLPTSSFTAPNEKEPKKLFKKTSLFAGLGKGKFFALFNCMNDVNQNEKLHISLERKIDDLLTYFY